MISLNTQKDKHQLLAASNSPSNSQLDLHNTLTLTTNSFNRLLPLQVDSQITLKINIIHLDYLRVSSINLTDKSFALLLASFFSKVETKTINKPWHPDPKMPKSKKYQNKITSKSGIILGYTKRAKNRGLNTRYVYDIMTDFTGAYFANLSLIEQQKVINYLNSNWQLKCHRLDVAIDDYSRKLFPVPEMIRAFLYGYNFGFKVIDDSYLDILDNQLVGTLGIGSRFSELFIRIYTKHRYFVRYEAEFKRRKAQNLFTKLSNLGQDKADGSPLTKNIAKALVSAALDCIDFRDKRQGNSPKNATKNRGDRLPFWDICRNQIFSCIEQQAISNEFKK
jgi:hypothetical protein